MICATTWKRFARQNELLGKKTELAVPELKGE